MRRFAYRLAKELGYSNVDRMLRSMTWKQLMEWKTFSDLEPFGEDRDDYRSAQVVQALWNIARDPKRHPQGWPLHEFLLTFGDRPGSTTTSQPVAYQEMLIDAWIVGSNAVFNRA